MDAPTPKKKKGRSKKKKNRVLDFTGVASMARKVRLLTPLTPKPPPKQDFGVVPKNLTGPFEHFRPHEVPGHKLLMEQSYTWDIAMVFQLPVNGANSRGEGNALDKTEESCMDFITRYVTGIDSAGLKYMLYKSTDEARLICLVGGAELRLREQAGVSDYDVNLDEKESLEQAGAIGLKLAKHTEEGLLEKGAWEGLYGPFELHDEDLPARYKLYKVYDDQGILHPNTIFRTNDRLKLTKYIVEGDGSRNGASLAIERDRLKPKCPLLGFFPLHNESERKGLQKVLYKWGMFMKPPLDEIQGYFGEEVGLYFAFLTHYTRSLLPVAVVGVFFFVWQVFENKVDVLGFPFMGILFVPVWATYFLEQWKQKEATLAVQWGMSEFLDKEEKRPEFVGKPVVSPVTGYDDIEFSHSEYACRQCCSQSLIMTCLLVVLAFVTSIFILRSVLTPILGTLTNPLVAVLNALQIMVLNNIWGKVSRKLNDWENHRTKSAYVSSLIMKSFMFKAINSYASLFYIAFVKMHDSGCKNDDCLGELQMQLGVIFLTQIIVNNAIELAGPWVTKKLAQRKMAKTEAQETAAEMEFGMSQYESSFSDFDELVLQFGYLTLFVVCFPIAPLVALLANILEGRLDSTKLLEMTRRPMPEGAATIGMWFNVMRLISYVCIVTNSLLALIHASFFSDLDLLYKMIIFIAMEHFIFTIKLVVESMIPDVPFEVQRHVKRQTLIVNHLIRGMDMQNDTFAVGDDVKKIRRRVKSMVANMPDRPQDSIHFASPFLPENGVGTEEEKLRDSGF